MQKLVPCLYNICRLAEDCDTDDKEKIIENLKTIESMIPQAVKDLEEAIYDEERSEYCRWAAQSSWDACSKNIEDEDD